MSDRLRVLFVDDEPNVLHGIRNMLRRRRHDWDMQFATGGEEAIRALTESRFDLVVSDLRMPGIDGVGVLRFAQERCPGTARVVLSGQADMVTVLSVVPHAQQYLSKPCSPERLVELIERTQALRDRLGRPEVAAVGRLRGLPSPSRLYRRLSDLTRDPDSSVAEAADIVAEDPAMTARILQLVNSAFFGLPRRVVNVHQACMYLGMTTLRDLALSAGVFGEVDETAVAHLDLDAMQHHGLHVARLARDMLTDKAERELAFVSGLVHDIGVVVMAMLDPERHARAMKSDEPNQAERRAFGFTHADAGAYLLNLWGLPYGVVETVAFHHAPGAHGVPDRVTPGVAVHLAETFADHGHLDRIDPRLKGSPALAREIEAVRAVGGGGR